MIKAVAVLGLLWLGACNGDDREEVREPSWLAEPRLTIGSQDGADALSSINDIAVGDDGSIYVLQTMTHELTRFGADGVLHLKAGGPGNGPGEFRSAFTMGWKQDTLWVVDWGRVHFFDSELRPISTVVPAPGRYPEGVDKAIPVAVMADGTLLSFPATSNGTGREVVFLMTRSGGTGNVLAQMPMDHLINVEVAERVTTVVQDPWSDAPLIVAAADGASIVVLNRGTAPARDRGILELLRIDLAGDTVLHHRVPYTPLPVLSETVDSLFRATAAQSAGRDSSLIPTIEAAFRRRIRPPEYEVAVSHIIAGDDGSIWLRREPRRSPGGLHLWQVYSEEGKEIGSITVPRELDILHATASTIWGRFEDSLGVHYVKKYQIRGAS